MSDFFVGTQGQCIAYNKKIDMQVGGYPTPDGRTSTYSDPRPHQGTLNNAGQTNVYIMSIEPLYSYLFRRQGHVADIDAVSTTDEKTNRKSIALLKSEGAFNWPVPEGHQP